MGGLILYKHISCKDVAVEVVKKFYIEEKDMYSMKIEWWNVCPSHPPVPMGFRQRIRISRKEWVEKWKPWEEGDWHVWEE